MDKIANAIRYVEEFSPLTFLKEFDELMSRLEMILQFRSMGFTTTISADKISVGTISAAKIATISSDNTLEVKENGYYSSSSGTFIYT